jgi:hypothetical protein
VESEDVGGGVEPEGGGLEVVKDIATLSKRGVSDVATTCSCGRLDWLVMCDCL